MNSPQQTVLLGAPKEVALAALEQELTQLWKETESSRADSFHPVVRACTMNLIVVTEDEQGADAVAAMVGEVTMEHPARILLAVLDRRANESSLNAWISARCAIPEPGQEQVCSEQITLVARGEDVGKIASSVTSLLVPDVPTVLLWKTSVRTSDPVLRSLLAISDRAMIDSSEELAPLPTLLAWGALAREGSETATLGDLGWTHATAWRAVLAKAFEPVEVRRFLYATDTVVVEYSASTTPRHSGFSQALLLTAWLAHVLEWRNKGIPCEVRGGSVSFSFFRQENMVSVQLNPVASPANEPGGIERMTIGAGAGFSIELQEGEPRSEIVMTETRGGHKKECVVPLRTLSESELMADELEILQRDEQYEQALNTLAAVVAGEGKP